MNLGVLEAQAMQRCLILIHWWLFLKDMFRWVDISINGKKAPLIKCKLITTSPMVTRNYKVVESFRNCGGNQTNQLQGNRMAKIKQDI